MPATHLYIANTRPQHRKPRATTVTKEPRPEKRAVSLILYQPSVFEVRIETGVLVCSGLFFPQMRPRAWKRTIKKPSLAAALDLSPPRLLLTRHPGAYAPERKWRGTKGGRRACA